MVYTEIVRIPSPCRKPLKRLPNFNVACDPKLKPGENEKSSLDTLSSRPSSESRRSKVSTTCLKQVVFGLLLKALIGDQPSLRSRSLMCLRLADLALLYSSACLRSSHERSGLLVTTMMVTRHDSKAGSKIIRHR